MTPNPGEESCLRGAARLRRNVSCHLSYRIRVKDSMPSDSANRGSRIEENTIGDSLFAIRVPARMRSIRPDSVSYTRSASAGTPKRATGRGMTRNRVAPFGHARFAFARREWGCSRLAVGGCFHRPARRTLDADFEWMPPFPGLESVSAEDGSAGCLHEGMGPSGYEVVLDRLENGFGRGCAGPSDGSSEDGFSPGARASFPRPRRGGLSSADHEPEALDHTPREASSTSPRSRPPERPRGATHRLPTPRSGATKGRSE